MSIPVWCNSLWICGYSCGLGYSLSHLDRFDNLGIHPYHYVVSKLNNVLYLWAHL